MRAGALLFLAAAALGCRVRGPDLPPPAAPGAVVVLRTDDLPEWRAPAEAFAAENGRPTVTVTLKDFGIEDLSRTRDWGYAAELARQLRDRYRPALVFALGTQAAWMARQFLPDVPAVFAGSVAWETLELAGGHMTGVSMAVPPDTLLTQFKLVVPRARRVGVIYNPDYVGGDVGRARQIAQRLGLALVERPIRDAGAFAGALGSLEGLVDALWLPGDPASMTRDNVELARRFAEDRKLPTLVHRVELVKQGFLLSVSVDWAAIGSQAASIASTILDDRVLPARVPVASPIGTSVVLSACAAARLRLPLDDAALSLASEVVECP